MPGLENTNVGQFLSFMKNLWFQFFKKERKNGPGFSSSFPPPKGTPGLILV
jgi:hypothetical protein